MIRGLDTSFLIQVEVAGHPGHENARALMERLLDQGDLLGLAPQVLGEFLHVVSDPRRFERPLDMDQAVRRAQFWWDAREVERIHPSTESTRLFLSWMTQHRLGRKRMVIVRNILIRIQKRTMLFMCKVYLP